MDESEIRASFTQLLQICTTFAAMATPGADIRDYGLSEELLVRCPRAFAAWQVDPAPPPGAGVEAPGAMAIIGCSFSPTHHRHDSTYQLRLGHYPADTIKKLEQGDHFKLGATSRYSFPV